MFSTFIPLPKKGDLKQCANYRTIALVSHASNILPWIIVDRIRVKTKTDVADEQAGFLQGSLGDKRPNHESQNTDAQAREHQQPLYVCFVDLKKAFDLISHDKLWVTVMDMGYPLHCTGNSSLRSK